MSLLIFDVTLIAHGRLVAISITKRQLLRVFREIISDILSIPVNSSGRNAEHFNVEGG